MKFSLVAQMVKESTCKAGDLSLIPGLGRSPGERNGNPFQLPGESHGHRSLVGYSPWGHKELGTTERLTLSLSAKQLEPLYKGSCLIDTAAGLSKEFNSKRMEH